jgi:hypothetical protein
LLDFMDIWFVVIWYIFPVLVFLRKNLATMAHRSCYIGDSQIVLG